MTTHFYRPDDPEIQPKKTDNKNHSARNCCYVAPTAHPAQQQMAGTGGDGYDHHDPQSATTAPEQPPTSFHLFRFLPAELRLRIWQLSFEPRIVELHSRRSHYADDYKHGGVAQWQSGCTNPAALSVSVEARAAALRHYCAKLPLAVVAPCHIAGNSTVSLHRVLYVCPAVDTVVILGDADFERLGTLLSDIRFRERNSPYGGGCGCGRGGKGGGKGGRKGRREVDSGEHCVGLRRLAISARLTYHAGAGAMMRVFARTMFRDLDELVVFMFDQRVPPDDWVGGVCSLHNCNATDYYKRYAMGRGQELRDGNDWMVVGKKQLKVMDLSFRPGW